MNIEIEEVDTEAFHATKQHVSTLKEVDGLSRREEIVQGYIKATKVKSSLVELVGSTSRCLLNTSSMTFFRFMTIEKFAEILVRTLTVEDQEHSSEQIQLVTNTLLQVASKLCGSSDFP
jgi:hypothetical protein